jgi:hypothetical protein
MRFLRTTGLKTWSKSLCKIGSVAINGAHSLVQSGGKLLVAANSGVFLYDIADKRMPRLVSVHECLRAKSISRPLGVEAGTILAAMQDGTYELFRHFYGAPSLLDSSGAERAAPQED